ncbi:MAG: alkaline phosphatase family protein [Planctomycetota bacterium]
MKTPTTATRAVLVGWSSADWRVVSPLVDEGGMPNLAALVDRGVCGNLASLWPDLPPLSLTSIATGKRPHRHGILGFAEPDGAGGVRPITCHSRTATPLWSIASRAELESVVVNFGPTWPADQIAGACVSNRFVATLPEVIRDLQAGAGPGLVRIEDRTVNGTFASDGRGTVAP